jgi:hypothetical protein
MVGDPVFILGYPVGTGPNMEKGLDAAHQADLKARSPYPDATGDLLRVSFGKISPAERLVADKMLSADQLLAWRKNSALGLPSQDLDFDQLICSDADTVFGDSGGPAEFCRGGGRHECRWQDVALRERQSRGNLRARRSTDYCHNEAKNE